MGSRPTGSYAEHLAIASQGASLSFGQRTLWQDLDLAVKAGEYFAVLGPNGSGKSTLLKVILGLLALSRGSIEVLGQPARKGRIEIGYIPQQRALPANTPLRARDLVALGLDGHRWGPRLPSAKHRARVDELLEAVGASHYGNSPVGLLSGGEQQRLRIAQALAHRPKILLADEALLSLDINHQYAVAELIRDFNKEEGGTVIFVTHEINPIIDHVDRVLYLAHGRFTVGSVAEVMRSEVLSELYQSPVTVLRAQGRYVVIGGDNDQPHCGQELLG